MEHNGSLPGEVRPASASVMLETYLAEGLSLKDMPARYKADTGIDVSISAFKNAHARRVRRGEAKPQRVRHKEEIPWRIKTEHMRGEARKWYDLLLYTAQALHGKQLSDHEMYQVNARLKELQNDSRGPVSIMYSPDLGFRRVERKPWHRRLTDDVWIVPPGDDPPED